MECLFPYSHFFEILAGVYFGGIALLSFLEKDATQHTYSRLQQRLTEANNAKIFLQDYFKVKVNNMENGHWRAIKNVIVWSIKDFVLRRADRFFAFASRSLDKIVSHKDNKILQKKFFPSFFFAGCFSLWIVLTSALQEAKLGTTACLIGSNRFMVIYLFASFVFFMWSIFFHIKKVQKKDYLRLLINNIFVAVVLFVLCILGGFNMFPWLTNWLLADTNKEWLALLMILVSLLPMLIIFTSSIFIFFCWEVPVLLNKNIIRRYGKIDITEEIEEITQ